MPSAPKPPLALVEKAKVDEKFSSAAPDSACCQAVSPSSSTQSSSTRSYLYAALMGLLTSSCCIIQLVLNAFSIGCAGFSVLTPLRPIFVSLSIAMVVYNVVQYGRARPLQTAITVLIVATLSLSPELVAHKNHGGQLMPSSAWWSSLPQNSSWGVQLSLWSSSLSSTESKVVRPIAVSPAVDSGTCSMDQSTSTSSAVNNNAAQGHPAPSERKALLKDQDLPAKPPSLGVYKVRVEGMKCEACANRLQRAFQAQPGVRKCNVYFKDKHLYLWGESSWTESQIKQVIAGVDFKYRATLLAQEPVESTDDPSIL